MEREKTLKRKFCTHLRETVPKDPPLLYEYVILITGVSKLSIHSGAIGVVQHLMS